MRISRVLAVLALLYFGGFALFSVSLGRPLDGKITDAIVVPTGGPERIPRGLEVLGDKQARRMLISGTAPGVTPGDLRRQYDADARLFACCIDLGHEAVDTRSNADETAQWVRTHGYKSVRLITADWHMPRARLELIHALGPEVEVVGDGVRTNPAFAMLVREYNKYLVRRVALLVGFAG